MVNGKDNGTVPLTTVLTPELKQKIADVTPSLKASPEEKGPWTAHGLTKEQALAKADAGLFAEADAIAAHNPALAGRIMGLINFNSDPALAFKILNKISAEEPMIALQGDGLYHPKDSPDVKHTGKDKDNTLGGYKA